MKNGHLKVRTQSTVKYSYPPETFIMVACVLLTMLDIVKDYPRQYFKTERVVSLKIIST